MRALRDRGDVSREDAAAATHGSVQTIGHIETGRQLPTGLQIEKLLPLYGVPELVPVYLDLRRRAKTARDWWSAFADPVPRHRALLYGAEWAAERVAVWDPFALPELLRPLPADGGRDAELARARQRAVLDRPTPPRLTFLVGETVLLGLRRDQAEQVLALTRRPRLDLRAVPPAATGVGGTGSFTVLDLVGPGARAAVYAETLVDGYYYHEPDRVGRYRAAFDELCRAARSPAETTALLPG